MDMENVKAQFQKTMELDKYMETHRYGYPVELQFSDMDEMEAYQNMMLKKHPNPLRKKVAQFIIDCLCNKPAEETVKKWAKELQHGS